MIRYLRHEEIDKVAWDTHLAGCADRLWYGTTGVLDAAAPGWEALVEEGSGARMALPWRRKFGVVYAYQPFLLQQLGPFGATDADATARFVEALPARYRYADIALTNGRPRHDIPGTRFDVHTNITVPLHRSVEGLREGYSVNHRRSLKKAGKAGLRLVHGTSVERLSDFLIGSEQFRRWRIDARRMEVMRRLFHWAMDQGQGLVRTVELEGRTVAGGFFVRWGGRVIFLKGLANAEGRTCGAMHALIDGVMAEHADGPWVFDLAGSNDPDLARFYLGFGGEQHEYLRALVDRLPALLKLIKK